jgi:CO/xanthine dehydrogenase FAD-binding subunit
LNTEKVVEGSVIDEALILKAREAARGEIRPIDDVRSTAAYRAQVTGNLVAEFLEKLAASGNNA